MSRPADLVVAQVSAPQWAWAATVVALVLGLSLGACTSDGGIGDVDVEDTGRDGATGDGVAADGEVDVGPELPPVDACDTDADCQALVADNPCRLALCDTLAGRCVVGPKKNYTPCDDGSRCTAEDICLSGECTGGVEVNCGDGNPCTDNVCDPDEGCLFPDNNIVCDDGNTCTTGDRCGEGVCAGTPEASCACEADAECLIHDDGNLCNGLLSCVEGLCTNDPGTAVVCDTSGDTDCFRTACDGDTGACVALVLSDLPCNDGNPCSVGDTCQAGQCVAGSDQCPCDVDGDCAEFDDDNLCNGTLSCVEARCRVAAESLVVCEASGAGSCVKAVCVPETGGCSTAPLALGVACDDGDACTVGEQCSESGCEGEAVVCDDEEGCTDDRCEAAVGCVFEANAAACDDGDACTEGDGCAGGTCVGGAAVDCDDSDQCTVDACDAASGCEHVVAVGPCEDGEACTAEDLCDGAGVCAGSAFECAACESCDGAGGCELQPGFCLIAGVCVAEGAVNPDNPCLACAAAMDAEGWTADDALPCDDGATCTSDDGCEAGFCTGAGSGCDICETCGEDGGCVLVAGACKIDGECVLAVAAEPGNPCRACLPQVASGEWSANDAGSCGDSDPCNGEDVCTGGACVAGEVPDCDDGDPCTDDVCEAGVGCQHSHNTAACDDEDACTEADVCAAGVCGGVAVVCDDENPCTDDGCDVVSGCVTADNVEPCDDGDACTEGDLCQGGVCDGPAVDCDDENPCTDDGCEPATGCLWVANEDSCDDGSACTDDDVCGATVCAGTAVGCDDENPCTDDGCDVLSGCVWSDNAAACDDGDACTVDDVCAGGGCGGAPRVCDDADPCTDDGCAPESGCTTVDNNADCDDGDACTEEDVCASGQCEGTLVDCDDGSVCTADDCDVLAGCTTTPVPGDCDDNSVCTLDDRCEGGVCTGDLLDCEDDSSCTDNWCDDLFGCVTDAMVDGAACFDEGVCGGDGVCEDGECDCPPPDCDVLDTTCADASWDAVAKVCVLSARNPGAACDGDGDGCTRDTCQGVVCEVGASVSCNEAGDLCNFAECRSVDPLLWVCATQPATGLPCNDGTACTTNTKCQAAPVLSFGYDHAAQTTQLTLDRSGRDHHGTVGSGVSLAAGGPTGSHLSCDGTGQVTLTAKPSLEIAGPGLTVMTRFRADDVTASSQVLVSKDLSWMLGLNVGVLSCAVRIDGAWAWHGSQEVGAGEWHHGACTFDGQRLSVWLDGVVVDTVEIWGALTPTLPTARLCARQEGFFFAGDLADTRVFPRALSKGELWSVASDAASWGAGGASCGGAAWPVDCCQVDSHCDDALTCTADTCVGGLCQRPPAVLCDLPGNVCSFEFCSESVDMDPICLASPGTTLPTWQQGFEGARQVGPRVSGFGLSTNAAASPECAWHLVDTDQVSAQLTAAGCNSGTQCLYAGNLSTWSYDHGVCDASATGPLIEIPTGTTATLKGWLWAEILDGAAGGDQLEVRLDGLIIATLGGPALNTAGTWAPFTWDLGAVADGGVHQLTFRFSTADDVFNSGGGVLLDDLRLTVTEAGCP